jgi:DDE superfamily endonuclease/Helix-turn-helix of DDE superfamily endonuclease
MLRYQDICTKKSRFIALTGLHIEEFVVLLTHFQKAFDWSMQHSTMTGKKREYRRYTTYSNRPLPTMEDKLFFILVYLKHNLHQEIQGCLFGMSQTNVSKWTHLLHRILNQALAQQSYLPARTAEEFAVYLQDRAKTDVSHRTPGGRSDPGETRSEVSAISPTSPENDIDTDTSTDNEMNPQKVSRDATIPHGTAREQEPSLDSGVAQETVTEATAETVAARTFFHDGVERPINRPCDPFDQEDYYSGKKKQHMLKNIIIATIQGEIPFLSDTRFGKLHDKRAADESRYTFPTGSHVYQDTGFQGFAPPEVIIIQPKKKPRGGELTLAEKEENRRISSIRVFIEHVICSVKRYRIVKEKIRLWKGNIRDTIMETCCGLHNFRITFRPMRYAENKS